MTQQVLRCRFVIPTVNVEMDNISIDFIIEATGANPNINFGAVETPGSALHDFFNGTSGRTEALSAYISAEYSRVANACSIEYYDITAHLDGSAAGAPIRIDQASLEVDAHTVGVDLHPALSLVGAYRRDYNTDPEHAGTTRPRARDRGRIYVGPLNGWAQYDGTGQTRPVVKTDLLVAMNKLAETHNNGETDQWNWVQWSRKSASVQPIRWVATQYGLGLQRRRADEQNTRVLGWQAVT